MLLKGMKQFRGGELRRWLKLSSWIWGTNDGGKSPPPPPGRICEIEFLRVTSLIGGQYAFSPFTVGKSNKTKSKSYYHDYLLLYLLFASRPLQLVQNKNKLTRNT